MKKIRPIALPTFFAPAKPAKPTTRAAHKVRPSAAAPIAASLLLATLFSPTAVHASTPGGLSARPTTVTRKAAPARPVTTPRASAYNTRNRTGKESALPLPPNTAKKRLPAAAAPQFAPVQSVDYLLFCNQPERLSQPGAYADTKLIGGRTYRIFFHYRNASGRTAPFVLAFHGTAGKPLSLVLRKGLADPQKDPPRAGRQALVRYLEARPTTQSNARGAIAVPLTLHAYDTASGIVTVRPSQDCRFRILFADGRRLVRGGRITAVPTPKREVSVALTDKSPVQYFRIGAADDLTIRSNGANGKAMAKNPMDGSYGLVYSFSVRAPAGRRVRVTFSPRGGQAGMVALLNGTLRSSDIIGPAGMAVFAESTVTQSGFGLVTMPFGGVFYPVEIAFHLL